jgi:hypothetical protein
MKETDVSVIKLVRKTHPSVIAKRNNYLQSGASKA